MTSEGFRLSPQQRRLWSCIPHTEPGAYGSRAQLKISGALDVARLERAVIEVARKYEILRTNYRPSSGSADEVRQVAHEQPELTFETEDWSARDEAERRARVELRWSEVAATRSASESSKAELRFLCVSSGALEHELFANFPALAADSASLAQWVRELAASYEALSGGSEFELEALQYADVAEWQNELVESDESAPGRDFWRALEPARGTDLEIPFQSLGGTAGPFATVARTLAAPSREALARVGNALGAERETILAAGWIALLRRLSGESEILIGFGRDGRRHDELTEVIGLLACYAPLRATLELDTTFAEAVRALEAQRVDSERWHECFAWERHSAGDGAAFPFVFELNSAAPPTTGGGVTFELARRFVAADRFACRLRVEETPADGVELAFDYDVNAFSSATVERLADQFVTLLESALEDPERETAALSVLGPAERQRLLYDFNDTDAEYPRGRLAHRWIEEAAERTPDHVAVRQGERELTYGELEVRANQLAHHLLARGVGPDTLVALCVERSVEMVIGIVGILKAGGAYVPVDPAYPAERFLFLLEDTRAPVLVTSQALLERLPESSAEVVCLDRDRAQIDLHPTEAPVCPARPGNLVYVIYTSGSTGKPKGVVITHEKLVISNSARIAYFGHTPDTFLLLSSFAFDSSVVGLFWTLCGGGTLLLIPEGSEKDIGEIPRVIERERVSHLLTLPSFYTHILEAGSGGELAGLRAAIVAGEACPLRMVNRHRELLDGVGLFSEYGATETTVFSSVYDCLEQTLPIAPVGGPIDNAQMYVLDERLEPCPTGVPGEVHFGGIALALGYWNRPALTAERFIAHPFVETAGARLYKSGDLARHLENGDVEFLGRLDNQVKIRGYRIELEEIEIALVKHPSIKESAVLALTDISDEKRLVGYVSTEGAKTATIAELRDFLLESLPDFMVPAVFVFLEDFPRTANGKLDRKALPEPSAERPELESEFAAAESGAEAALADIWRSVLGLDSVGVNDNFFELGGDSILSIQIVSRAKQAGIKLTPRQLFENQTVASLACVASFDEAVLGGADSDEQGAIVGPVEFTPVQRWFLEQELTERDHWNMPTLLEVARPVDSANLARAAEVILAHHDALRTRLVRGDAGWSQEILALEDAPSADELVAVEDLAGLSADEQDVALDSRAAAHQTALSLEQGRLMRLVLFDLGAERPQRLLWIVHHLVVDGVSWRILIEDLERALEALEQGASVSLPAKTTSYKRWAKRLVQYAAKPERALELEPWFELEGRSRSVLPRDFTDAENLEGSKESVRVALDGEATRSLLSEVPKAYNTQINDVLLTALTRAICGWTGESSLVVGLEGHGREDVIEDVDLARSVGWFTTDCPIQLSIESPFDPGRALRTIKEELRRIERQGFAFGVGRYLSPDPAIADRLASIGASEIGFNYLGQFDAVLADDARFRLVSSPAGPAYAASGRRPFVLEVYGGVSDGCLTMEFEYSANLHERATIEKVAATFEGALRELIVHCVSSEAGGFTKSDVSDFAWGDADLDAITSAIQKSQAGRENDQ